MTRAVRIGALSGTLHGELPARRAALLLHGATWDASGWADVAPRFVDRGVPALALNFRRSSTIADVGAATEWLRANGAGEVALVGASMGGTAALRASASVAPECVVAISAPVRPMSAGEAGAIVGRKLFVCAERDSLGATEAVKRAYADATEPKKLRLFPGRAHSKGMFEQSYGAEALDLIVSFVAEGL